MFALTIAIAITVAAEQRNKDAPANSFMYKSNNIATVLASDTTINVRKPAACLLLLRSVPIIAARAIVKVILNKTLQAFIS